MEYLIKNKSLPLIYQPGKGSWTYHLRIPNSKHIKGKWGDIKVSGSIDGYVIENRNLAPIKNEDKMLSVNGAIRKAINKVGGDTVMVTLYFLSKKETIGEKEIVASFEDGAVLAAFKRLAKAEQKEWIQKIKTATSEEKQIKLISDCINQLQKLTS